MTRWKLIASTFLLAALSACAHPPRLSTSLDILKDSPDLVVLKLKVVNLEDRVTVPIAIQLTGQAEENGQWDKSITLLQPAAFVLNRKEERTITKLWHISPQAVRTTLVVREQESGNLLKSEKFEKTL
ncbi:MAG TPA: hypothetical protein VLW25_06150 [Bryobacteraceae bacterium]|jgi:hypothetical protein|nr:hypothetical protein [Bryobacteraceae bacterium]